MPTSTAVSGAAGAANGRPSRIVGPSKPYPAAMSSWKSPIRRAAPACGPRCRGLPLPRPRGLQRDVTRCRGPRRGRPPRTAAVSRRRRGATLGRVLQKTEKPSRSSGARAAARRPRHHRALGVAHLHQPPPWRSAPIAAAAESPQSASTTRSAPSRQASRRASARPSPVGSATSAPRRQGALAALGAARHGHDAPGAPGPRGLDGHLPHDPARPQHDHRLPARRERAALAHRHPAGEAGDAERHRQLVRDPVGHRHQALVGTVTSSAKAAGHGEAPHARARRVDPRPPPRPPPRRRG